MPSRYQALPNGSWQAIETLAGCPTMRDHPRLRALLERLPFWLFLVGVGLGLYTMLSR